MIFFSFVAVETINGTGVSGVDFEAKNETITVSPSANATLEIELRTADGTCELDEKQFQMAIYDQNGDLIGSTVNVTAEPDTQCGKPFCWYWLNNDLDNFRIPRNCILKCHYLE